MIEGKIFITRKEIIGTPFYINESQTMLLIMKDKGVPILGNFYLKLDPLYNYTSQRIFPDGGVEITWKKLMGKNKKLLPY